MKIQILAGLIIAGALAASAAQAEITSVDELYSGMTAAEIQKDQQANPAAARHSSGKETTCVWVEPKVVDQLYAPYPDSESTHGLKTYLAAANFSFACTN